MALGSYTVPPTEKAGREEHRGSGSVPRFGTEGLQPDFAEAVGQFLDRVEEEGGSVELGQYGFIDADSLQDMNDSGSGKPFYQMRRYFGFGLAAEVESSDASGLPDGTDFEDIAGECGLYFSLTSGGLRFLRPRDVETDPDATAVEYAGDSTAATTATGSSSGVNVFFFQDQYKSIVSDAMAEALTGERALANDEQLWGYVKTAVENSLRTCASGPNGEFFAWYPDYWGMAENSTPYLILEDIELIDLTVTQSDESVYTHVYCPGVTATGTSVSALLTQGCVTVESRTAAEASSALVWEDGEVAPASEEVSDILKRLVHIPEGEEWKYTPAEIYRRYGARPKNESCKTLVESGTDGMDPEENPAYILPFLHALNTFLKLWSQHYTCNLKITFMPELFPGCRIKLKSLDISFYVEKVTHSMSYTNGFTTTVTCSCPMGTLLSGMVDMNLGAGDE